MNKKRLAIAAFFAGMSLMSGAGEASAAGLVQCGTGPDMCTLCDLISGFNVIIQYVMKISIGVALLAIAVGGIIYVVSAGNTGTIDTAKKTISNAVIGFIVVFSAFLIVNTTIQYLGAIKDPQTGQPTLGIKITSWGQFDCTAAPR